MLDQNINTADATGRLVFHVLGAIAQFETEIRAERQSDGIAKALEKGVKFGRKHMLNAEDEVELKQARESGETISSLMRKFRLSKTTVYRYLGKEQR